jgi:hypothetical protein
MLGKSRDEDNSLSQNGNDPEAKMGSPVIEELYHGNRWFLCRTLALEPGLETIPH